MTDKKEKVRKELLSLQDKEYRDFQSRLFPTVDKKKVIGVRTPALRKLAKDMIKSGDHEAFISIMPHGYFDENQLHAFIISELKDFDRCILEVERFLPYVDNWATCDQMSPKAFKKHKEELLGYIRKWIVSGKTYTVRFAVGMLMQHYLDDDYSKEYPEMVSEVRSEEYYVNMMRAWYFATALAKQYDSIIPYIKQKKLDGWTHNKAIQKAIESRRITPEQKEYLRSLKV